MIDSYTDQILIQELQSQRGMQIPPKAPRADAVAKGNFEGVLSMYGRGCGSWWRGGVGVSFGSQFMGGGFPFGRGGRWGRFFGPGEVRLALLSMLEGGPKHGYELMKELETKSGGVYKASAGAVYPALQQLEDEGLVISDQAAGKRTYSLTDAGRAELEKEAETVKRIWLRAEEAGEWWIGPESAEVMRPAAGVMKAAMRVATRRWHDGSKIEKIRQILERTKREIEELEKS